MNCQDCLPCEDLQKVLDALSSVKNQSFIPDLQQIAILEVAANIQCPYYDMNRERNSKPYTNDFHKDVKASLEDFLTACNCAHK